MSGSRIGSGAKPPSRAGSTPGESFTADPVFDGLLREIAAAPVPDSAAPVDEPLPCEVGAVLGAFTLLEVIGRGGFSVVYRARDERLGREVAIKLLWRRPNNEGHAAADPLLFEARTIAAVSDPRVASIYEVGEAHGHTFIAMELVRGATLAAQLHEATPDRRTAVALASQIAGALASIHAQGWVHRDVKPENIAIGPDDTIKLLDFGIARRAGATEDATAAGTPAYMAPEQRRGENVDARADVFAFGVLLQQLLTGRASQRPLSDTIVHRHDREGRPLARLVEACLAVDPADRPASGGALVTCLEAVAGARDRRRRRLGFAVAALAVATLVVGVGLFARARVESSAGPRDARSLRLTGNRLDRPISAAAISWSGRAFAFIDDDGMILGATARPDETSRVVIDGHATFVEAIPGTNAWSVLTSTGDGSPTLWRLDEDGSNPERILEGDFRIASIDPIEGRVALVTTTTIAVRTRDGRTEWSEVAPRGRLFGAATWSPDGSRLAVSFAKLETFGRMPCLEVWDAQTRAVLHSICSPRLAQAYSPVVFGWGPDNVLAYALSDAPGRGNGTAVLAQRFDAEHAPQGPPSVLSTLDQQSLANVALTQDGTLLTLRQQIQWRPKIARVSAAGVLEGRENLGQSELDARLSAWADDDTLWRMTYRAWVPRVGLVAAHGGDESSVSLPGWAQTWPVPVAGGGTLFWSADEPANDEPPTWRLALVVNDDVHWVETPQKPREHLGPTSAPPSTIVVRCAPSATTCLLGAPDAGRYVLYRIDLDGGAPERLFALAEFHPVLGAWQILPDGTGIVVGSRGGALITYDLAGRVIERVQLSYIQWIRSIAVDRTSKAIFVGGHGPLPENFRIVRWDGAGETLVAKHGAVVYLDLLAGSDGRLAFVEKSIDTDVWLTIF